MADPKTTRRAGLALVAAGVATAIPYTRGFTTTVADRVTTAETAPDPTALLGISGLGSPPYDEFTVHNNAGAQMEVTVQTSAFELENVGGTYTATVTLPVGSSQLVDVLPETSNTDTIRFDATVFDGGGGPTTIELERTLSIPVVAGTTYRIRAVHSGLFLTGDAPGGGFGNPGDAYQDTWQNTDDQRWTLQADDGAFVLEHVSSGALFSLENFCFNGCGGGGVTNAAVRGTLGFGPGDGQRWTPIENPDGSYRLENVGNGDVLDVENESTAPGGNAITYSWKGPNPGIRNQFWVWDPV